MDRDKFFRKYLISPEDFKKTGLVWDELVKIKSHYESLYSSLEQVAADIADRIRKSTEEVHSVKFRVKSSEHLVEKIIRKKIKNPDRDINYSNYQNQITDLVGVRVLHLFKADWEPIHKFIQQSWNLNETPLAYYREGDQDDQLKSYEAKGCERAKHEFGYRSVHYVIKTAPTKDTQLVEIQVRTLFEEAWSEIDHKIRYPYDLKNNLLMPYLVLFNRLAGSADEMGSYVRTLQAGLSEYEEARVRERADSEKKISGLEKKIQSLSIAQKQKSDLENELKSLKTHFEPFSKLYVPISGALTLTPSPISFPTSSSTQISDMFKGMSTASATFMDTMSKAESAINASIVIRSPFESKIEDIQSNYLSGANKKDKK